MSSISPHLALLYSDRNPWFTQDELVFQDTPFRVIDTPDWRLRSRFVAREISCETDFIKGLESRCSFFLSAFPVPDTLDIRYARCCSEQRYARFIADLPLHPFPHEVNVTRDMMMVTPRMLGVGNDGSLSFTSRQGDQVNALYRPDRHLRLFERRHRHRLNAFICYHDRQVGGLHPRYIESRYWRLPGWWNEFEVPYHFASQSPPVLAYRGLHLMSTNDHGWTLIVRAEWAALCAVELYDQACEGCLWWLPPRIIEDIESLGVSYIFDGASPSTIADIDRLLWEIKGIRWNQVSNVNRFVPGTARDPTPSYDNVDFVEFNVDDWHTELPSDMYVPLDDNDEPLEIADRGRRLYGDTRFWPSHVNPNGRAPGLDEYNREPSYRLEDRHGYSQSKWGVARSVVRSLAEQHGVLALRRDLGLSCAFDPQSLMMHYRELLLEKTVALREGREAINVSNGTSVPGHTPQVTSHPSTSRLPSRDTPQSQVPVLDLTGNDGNAEVIEPPRMESLPGSVADHAALASRTDGPTVVPIPPQQDRGTGIRSRPVVAVSSAQQPSLARQITSSVEPVLPVVPYINPVVSLMTPGERVEHNLWIQSYVELIREGIIIPTQPHPHDPAAQSWNTAIRLRQIQNGARGAPFPRNIGERVVARIDPVLLAHQNASWALNVPTMITGDGTLTYEGQIPMGGPSQQNAITAATEAVAEAQQAAGLQFPSSTQGGYHH